MEPSIVVRRFLDQEGRITQLPHKQKPRRALLEYLAGKFTPDIIYSEGQVNCICDQWHTFNDYFLLRRELVDSGLLERKRDGSQYWLAAPPPAEPDEGRA